MDLIFGSYSIFRFGVLTYIGLWAYVLWRTTKKAKNNIDLKRAERFFAFPWLVKYVGWFLILLMFVLVGNILPEISVIDKSRDYYTRYQTSYEADSIEQTGFYIRSFYSKDGFVPFCYDGHFCKPGTRYVYNATGETLEIYSVTFINGMFSSYSKEAVQIIPPGQLMPLEVEISDQFHIPTEWTGYVPKKYKGKEVTEYYLDLPKRVQRHRESIKEDIAKRLPPLLSN